MENEHILFSDVFSGGKRALPKILSSVRATIQLATDSTCVLKAQQRNKYEISCLNYFFKFMIIAVLHYISSSTVA